MRVVRREQCRELTHDGPALHGFEPVQDGECAGMAFGELAQLSSEDDGRLVAIGVEDDDVAVAAASADLRIDITGVIPLPAAHNSSLSSRLLGVNTPAGGRTSTSSPERTLSHNQLDPYPSAVRLTVTLSFSSQCGELASE